MQNETNSSDNPAQAKCVEIVKRLVQPGNPKCNLYALCIICDSDGHPWIAVNAVETLTPLEVAKSTQAMMNQLWNHANSGN